jgi:hypothetical protein
MDWAWPIVGAKGGKRLFGRIDGAGHATSRLGGRFAEGTRQASAVYNDLC